MPDIDLSQSKGVLAGMSAATLLPVAALAAARHLKQNGSGALFSAPREGVENLTSKLGDSVGSGIGDKVSEKVDEAGGPGGILKSVLPFGGGGDEDDDQDGEAGPGFGKGRRMPVQQSVDIGAPIETVYNQWTQFELWPNFMHRVTRVSQEDPCTVSFETKIWGKSKEFTANIETQRPDERVKWKVSQGLTHTGVVTFHELGPRLTRVLLNLDVEPSGMLEKLARGARHVKRAARGDLHRFKAFIEMSEQETGAWRGVIEDGEVQEDHDSSYDKDRDYADPQELLQSAEDDSEEGQDSEEEQDSEEDQDSKDEEDSGTRQSSGDSSRRGRSSSGSRGRESRGRSRSSGRSRGASSSGSGSGRRQVRH